MENYNTGAIQSSIDHRDYKWSNVASAILPYDWTKEFNIENVVGIIQHKDQKQTSSCGGFAWSYYSFVLDRTNREVKSPKFIYAHTHVGNGGSAGRENCQLCSNKGVSSEILCPLPDPLTEEAIIDKSTISDEAFKDALTNKSKSYLSVTPTIDNVAQAIENNNGCVLGVSGQNNGTWSSEFPKKPKSNDVWRHWVYAGKVKMINGKKHIGIINSWGNVGKNGWQWLSEDYFDLKNVWECWTMVYNDELVKNFVFTKTLRIGSSGLDVKMLQNKLGIKEDGKFGKDTFNAVKKYQLSKGLVSDGIVGPKTNVFLNK